MMMMMMMTVSCVCVFIRTTDNNEIFAFNKFLHKHINKTNTINTVDCTLASCDGKRGI